MGSSRAFVLMKSLLVGAALLAPSPMTSASDSRPPTSPSTNTAWVVRNPNKLNRFGKPVAYKLIGPANPLILAHPSSFTAKKGVFANKNLWVTPYDPEEFYPAGTYPTQNGAFVCCCCALQCRREAVCMFHACLYDGRA